MGRKMKLITFCLWYVVHVLCLVERNSAQTPTNVTTTDPAEVRIHPSDGPSSLKSRKNVFRTISSVRAGSLVDHFVPLRAAQRLRLDDRGGINLMGLAKPPSPAVAAALNSVFGEWGISALPTWNMSGNPCTGVAIDDAKSFDDPDMNPSIKCQCVVTRRNGSATTTCHIIELKVYAMSVVGTIPDALASLTHLTNLDLRQNRLTGPLPAFIGNMTGMEYL
ncbi:hypothetical protein ACLOJK_021367 [Asimina triloba]